MSRFSFAREFRLLDSTAFGKVFRSPIKSVDASLVVLARPNKHNSARLGLAIAKKQIARAVDRNRIKRVVRESFRHHKGDLSGLDLVVVSRSNALRQSNRALTTALNKHWDRLITQCKKS